MRILHISNGGVRIPPHTGGGTEAYLFNLARQFSILGHRVTVLDRKYSKTDNTVEYKEGVAIMRFNIPRLNFKRFKRNPRLNPTLYRVESILNRIIFGFRAALWLRFKNNFDVVHVHEIFIALPVLILNASRVRVFYTHHGILSPYDMPKIIGGAYLTLRVALAKRVQMIFALNPKQQSEFTSESKLSEKVSLVPVGVDVEKFVAKENHETIDTFMQNKRIVLYVGRINRHKGIEYLIKAANVLINELSYRDLMFLLVGPVAEFDYSATTSSYINELNDLIAHLQLGDYIKFLGSISDRDHIARLYELCEIFVLSSTLEVFPQAVLEAMSSCKPIVASKLPGTIMQITNGWNGLLVEPRNERQLTYAIQYLLDNPNIAKQMGKNARRAVLDRFEQSKIAHQILKAYLSRIQH